VTLAGGYDLNLMDKFELTERFRDAAESTLKAPDSLAMTRWSIDNWYQLGTMCEPVSVDAGDALITSCNTERALYLVCSGSVEVAYVVRQSLTISIMSHVAPGSVVGELSFFDSAPRSANVWAVENSQLLKLELREFERFADSNPRLGYDIMFALGRIMAQRVRSTTAKVSA
jgi:CRP-like cAMP-binding protein